MPSGSSHVGLSTFSGPNSNLILNDLSFHGGLIGMNLAGQQWVLKNITFTDLDTGVMATAFDLVLLGCHWQNVRVGVDAQSTSGSLTVVDSSGNGVFWLVKSHDSSSAAHSIILENVRISQGATTVVVGDKKELTGDVRGVWIRGNEVSVLALESLCRAERENVDRLTWSIMPAVPRRKHRQVHKCTRVGHSAESSTAGRRKPGLLHHAAPDV